MDLALNNLQRLIYQPTNKPTQMQWYLITVNFLPNTFQGIFNFVLLYPNLNIYAVPVTLCNCKYNQLKNQYIYIYI